MFKRLVLRSAGVYAMLGYLAVCDGGAPEAPAPSFSSAG